MGINKTTLNLLVNVVKKEKPKKVLTIGVQKVKPGINTSLRKYLKVDILDTISIDPKENPTYIKDLNYDIGMLSSYKYDLILDGGSLEHCINPSMVIYNILKNLKNEGVIIHYNPHNGWGDHGFFSFTKHFYEYVYKSNGANIVDYKLITGPKKKTKFLNWVVVRKKEDMSTFTLPIEDKYR